MIADKLISRLEGVRNTGQDRWLAKCPAHEDRSPSLAIREVDDRLLIHCFAGCSVFEICNAVGLEVSDLFEKRDTHEPAKKLSKPFPASDILKCISFESLFLKMCALHLRDGKSLTENDYQRLDLADKRISLAIKAGGLQ